MVCQFSEEDGRLLGENGLNEKVADNIRDDHREVTLQIGLPEPQKDG